MSDKIIIKASDFLNGVVPSAAFVRPLGGTVLSDYTVDGTGTLFTVDSDLYITDAALNGVISDDA